MDCLLNMWINRHHVCIQIGVLLDHDLWVKCCGDENCVDSTRQWCREYIGNLEADQECEGDDDRRVSAVTVVGRVREDKVEVSTGKLARLPGFRFIQVPCYVRE